ncbi:ABC transporter ATP-binding protein [Spirochaetia bacterium]|nr:ABC transporter ATP-binding protein [Spirochaetia bacterium]
MQYAVEMIHIHKEYGSVIANDDISLQIRPGAVTCLIGENGAGKSTLMHILYGLEEPTSGEIRIRGEKVSFASSRDAIKKRIGMVHQHFMLVNDLSVLENIILGMEPKKGFSLDYREAQKQVSTLCKKFGMIVPLNEKTGILAVGIRQKIEIIKAIYRGADIIILDEPTAVLTPQETQELFINMKKLTEDGKTVILITHKLRDVMQVADDIIVVRRGKIVAHMRVHETDMHALAEHMVGKALPIIHPREMVTGESILELENISAQSDNGIYVLKNVCFSIHKGEIFGIAGVSGNGQGELTQVIAGLMGICDGKINLDGEDITEMNRRERLLKGISYIPEDRKTDGLCLPWSISENIIAGYHIHKEFKNRFGLLDQINMNKLADHLIEQFDIRTPSRQTSVSSLSGGNQQKIVIARETVNNPKLIIAAEPTRGVDIGAISFIHNYLLDLRNSGTGVLLVSSDLDEIFRLSDRIAVLYEGEIVALVNPNEVTREELGLYMAGTKKERSSYA